MFPYTQNQNSFLIDLKPNLNEGWDSVTPTRYWFFLDNSQMVKAVTLCFSSVQ